MQAGDIIREINGVKIEDSQELMSYLKEHPLDGEKVSLGIERNGKVETIAAKPQMTKQIDSGFVYNIYREKTNFLEFFATASQRCATGFPLLLRVWLCL